MNEKTIEDALNLLISGELDLVDTALGEVSNIKTYAEAVSYTHLTLPTT